MPGAPPDDDIERRLIVAEAEARLFGGARAPVRLGRFEVTARLGAGGMGVVYAATDPGLDREVALKLLRADRPGDPEQIVREARAMARLAHPHVVPVYEVGLHDGRVFIAMERVAGQTAREWMRDRPWRDVLAVFVQAGHGIAAAHAANLIHGDFKPENVLVGHDGRARVSDFGIARPANDAAHGGGTPAYMAPEQRAGGPITVAIDQYAFCTSLFEALSGSRPDAASTPPIESGVPRRIWTALQRGRAPRADDRFSSLTALLDVIEAPPRRRTLRIVVWSVVSVVIAIALVGAVIQLVMFQHWMHQAEHGSPK